MKTYFYDIETLPNFFSAIFIEYDDYLSVRDEHKAANTFEEKKAILNSIPHYIFVLHEDQNDLLKVIDFMDQEMYLVSFNGERFDNVVMNYIYMYITKFKSNKDALDKIYAFVQDLIGTDLWENDLIRRIAFHGTKYQSVDLMLILAFDKLGKNLKQTGINLSWYWIQDMPIKHDDIIRFDQHDDIIDYNKNDVHITAELFCTILEDVKLRMGIKAKYGLNVLSASDSKIADKFFAKLYTDFAGITYKEFKNAEVTHRNWIRVGDCLSSKVKFVTDTFNDLLGELKNKNIRRTKGELEFKINFDDIYYELKTGGLHSKDRPAVFKEDEDNMIVDCDVTSYYPSMTINESICPEHLDKKAFNKIAVILRDDRIKAKEEGDKLAAQTLKIVINVGLFGKFGFEFGKLYDLFAMVQVTLNGQLFLLMLIEALVVKGYKVISANTDGIVTIVPRDREQEYISICEQWEQDTELNLEYTYYKLYVRRDVNNYFTIKTNNKPKHKGVFDKKRHIEGYPKLSKALSMPIVSECIEEYYTNNIPVMTTLTSAYERYGKDAIYMFCKSQKSARKYTQEVHTIKGDSLHVETLQKNVRYYVSNKGGTLYKNEIEYKVNHNKETIKINKRSHLCKGYNVTVFNNYVYYPTLREYDINYSYYYQETMKIINSISAGITGARNIKKQLGQFKLDL